MHDPSTFHEPDKETCSTLEAKVLGPGYKTTSVDAWPSSIHNCEPFSFSSSPPPPPLSLLSPPQMPGKVVASLRRKCRELKHGYEADILEARINSPLS